jgi:hypothetical protein
MTRFVTTPAILPERLSRIDATTRSHHHYLDEDDECLYFGEFFNRKDWSAGAINHLVMDYKKSPARIASHPRRERLLNYKSVAIWIIAAGLRAQFTPGDVATRYTFVPMPSSKAVGDPDHCDRLHVTLDEAFGRAPYAQADIRPLLRQTRSVAADHHSRGKRIDYSDLLAITEIDPGQLTTPVREQIVLFDDVLTSGKHYKVARTRIREALPGHPILGLFVACANHPFRPGGIG